MSAVSAERPGIGIIGQGFMGRAHAHALITIGHMTGPPDIRPRLVNVAGRGATAPAALAGRLGLQRPPTHRRGGGAGPARGRPPPPAPPTPPAPPPRGPGRP